MERIYCLFGLRRVSFFFSFVCGGGGFSVISFVSSSYV